MFFRDNRLSNEPSGAKFSKSTPLVPMSRVFEVASSLAVESTSSCVGTKTFSVFTAPPMKRKLKKRNKLKNKNNSLR